MSRENVELVRRAYEEGYARRSVEGFSGLFAPGFRFHMRSEFPGVRPWYALEELPQLWADLDETYTDYSLAPADFATFGAFVLVTLSARARLRGSDAWVDETLFHIWHLADGRVLEAWTYGDEQEALDAIRQARER